jgi:hypothetical protein
MRLVNIETRWEQNKYQHARVYVSVENESILDNLVNRRNRPYREYAPIVIDALAKVHGYRIDAKMVKWSQKAGCPCGCSPGFIVKGVPKNPKVFVTITDDPE